MCGGGWGIQSFPVSLKSTNTLGISFLGNVLLIIICDITRKSGRPLFAARPLGQSEGGGK